MPQKRGGYFGWISVNSHGCLTIYALEVLSLLLFGRSLRGMTGKGVDFGQPTVRFGICRPQGRRFAKIAKPIGILAGGLALPRKPEQGRVEQICRLGILLIELMRTAERVVGGKVFPEFRQNGSVESVQLKDIRPSLHGIGNGGTRLLKSVQSEVGERQVVLHLGGLWGRVRG